MDNLIKALSRVELGSVSLHEAVTFVKRELLTSTSRMTILDLILERSNRGSTSFQEFEKQLKERIGEE